MLASCCWLSPENGRGASAKRIFPVWQDAPWTRFSSFPWRVLFGASWLKKSQSPSCRPRSHPIATGTSHLPPCTRHLPSRRHLTSAKPNSKAAPKQSKDCSGMRCCRFRLMQISQWVRSCDRSMLSMSTHANKIVSDVVIAACCSVLSWKPDDAAQFVNEETTDETATEETCIV